MTRPYGFHEQFNVDIASIRMTTSPELRQGSIFRGDAAAAGQGRCVANCIQDLDKFSGLGRPSAKFGSLIWDDQWNDLPAVLAIPPEV